MMLEEGLPIYLAILGAYVALTVGICSLLAWRGSRRHAPKNKKSGLDRGETHVGTKL